jgi:polyhydroxyalkanoate synthesis repressor PhaR
MGAAQPNVIKKYGNRRLYNMSTDAYETLETLASMAKRGENFVVYDTKSGDDITRSVLTDIIADEEKKSGQDLLPVTFMRRLISFTAAQCRK